MVEPGPTPTVTAVLFDMGGVLVELGPISELLGPARPDQEFWPRWLASPSVRRFERGQCSVEEFGTGLRAEFDLDADPEEIIERIRRFPGGLFPGAAELVRSVSPGVVTGVLSNTNQLHWDHQDDADTVRQLFDRRFLSFELGLVKPDADIYLRVVADLDRPPGEILFLDDNEINVEGARAVGIRAERVVGPDEAALVLDRLALRAG